MCYSLATQIKAFATLTLDWAYVWGGSNVGTSNTDTAEYVARDTSGNLYVVGTFNGSTDLDPTAGTNTVTSPNRRAYVSKFDADGSYLWSKTFDSDDQNISMTAYSVAVDSTNNALYVAGDFVTGIDFDPGAGTNTPSGTTYLVKLDLDGNFSWVKATNATSHFATAVDSEGSVYVTGKYSANLDLNADAGTDTYTNAGGTDAFITKYDSAGTYQWSRVISAVGEQYFTALSLDGDNHLYLSGGFTGTNVDFDGTDGTDSTNSAGDEDAFLVKYTPDGEYVWGHSIGGEDWDTSYEPPVTATGDVYVVGTLMSLNTDFDPSEATANISTDNSGEVFVAKYLSDGGYDWARVFGGTDWDEGTAVTVDNSGNVFVTGAVTGTGDPDLDGTEGTDTKSSADWNTFIVKYNADGDYQYGDILLPASGYTTPNTILLSNQTVYVAGFMQAETDFDPGDGDTSPAVNGGQDAFLATYLDSSISGEDEGENNNNNSGSSSSVASAPFSVAKPEQCSYSEPTSAPDLFQIDVRPNTATLFFAPAGNTTKYVVMYGVGNTPQFGTEVQAGENNGVHKLDIDSLASGQKYTFWVLPVNICMPGKWSQHMTVTIPKTTSKKSYYYYSRLPLL